MSLNENIRRIVFNLIEEERGVNRSRVWTCSEGECRGDVRLSTDQLTRHLFSHHQEKFKQLEENGDINAITRRKDPTSQPGKGADFIVSPCEFCGMLFSNTDLSRHRGRSSYVGGYFGCPSRDEFFNSDKLGPELATALKEGTELTDDELEAAKEATAGGDDDKLAAVYIKVDADWMESGEHDLKKAEPHWRYTGKAKNIKQRMISYSSDNTRAKLRLGVGQDELEEEGTTTLIVLHDVPSKLAAAVEQALILLRRTHAENDHVNNLQIPYQVNFGWDHQKLRQFSAKALVTALRKREKVELVPIDETPTAKRRSSLNQQPRKRPSSDQQPSSSNAQQPSSSSDQQPSSSSAQQPSSSSAQPSNVAESTPRERLQSTFDRFDQQMEAMKAIDELSPRIRRMKMRKDEKFHSAHK